MLEVITTIKIIQNSFRNLCSYKQLVNLRGPQFFELYKKTFCFHISNQLDFGMIEQYLVSFYDFTKSKFSCL